MTPAPVLQPILRDAAGGPVGFPFFAFLPLALTALGAIVIVLLVVAGVAGESGSSVERRGRWLPLVYYYLGTVVGLALVLTGLIGGLHGLVTAALPKTGDSFGYTQPPFDQQGNPIKETKTQKAEREADALKQARQSGVAGAVNGGITALVGAPVFFWHLRQARRKEPEWLGSPR